MPNITYLIRTTKMGYEEVMRLPYPIFLSLLRENRILDLMEKPGGQEYLEKIERLKETSPDFNKLSKLNGFKKAGDN